MSIRLATPDEIKDWDNLIINNPDGGNALQGYDFAEIKKKYSSSIQFLICENPEIAFMAVEKSVPLFGKVWYLPKGPGVESVKQLNKIAKDLQEFADNNSIINIKVEPDLLKNQSGIDESILKPCGAIQPNKATVWISTKESIEEISKSLPQRGRRAIRQAEKAGVNVELADCTVENSKKMYDLYKETALDAGFANRGEQYYLDFYEQYSNSGKGKLFFAYHQGQLLAGAFVMLLGKKAIYKDGGSRRSKTANGVGHLLHWEIIKWLHDNGYEAYDFFGAPPANRIDDKTHPFYGIGLFKTSFNKEITEYIGAFNIPVGLRGQIWNKFFEKVVRRVYFLAKKQSFY